MSISETLWNKYISDAYASLYNPWVVGIATGQLPKSAWFEYLKQDIFYLRIYEAAYTHAIQMCESIHDEKHKSILEEICVGLRKELDSYVETVANNKEKEEAFTPKKATRDYTDLVTRSYENGCLSEIAAAICPCNKLYDFLGHEIASVFPNHNHDYSEWIRAYSGEQIIFDSNQLCEMLDFFPKPVNPVSLDEYYGEAMRLEFEFFDQQDHVPPLFTTTAIKCVGIGSASREGIGEKSQRIVEDFTELSLELLLSCLTPPDKISNTENSLYFQRLCENNRMKMTSIHDKPTASLSLGYGVFSELPSLLQFDIPVIIQPTEDELHVLQQCGVEVQRLLALFQYSPSSLPPKAVYYVNHFTEIGMTVFGSSFYKNQYHLFTPTMLTIAGSDSCGGAGIQADIKTATELGVFSSSCITAITSQNTQGVQLVELVSEKSLETQLECVCEDIDFSAVKIGMTGSYENVSMIQRAIMKYHLPNVVFDPVMAASSGHPLSKGDLCECFKQSLIPLCDLITPNLPETILLLGHSVEGTPEGMTKAAYELLELGCKNVLVKGGHMEGSEAVDVLVEGDSQNVSYFRHSFVFTNNSHGTGCTLSSAIASYLARGYSMKEAVEAGIMYIEETLKRSRNIHIGKGKHGIMNHMWMNYSYE